jgi:hypothetical protein
VHQGGDEARFIEETCTRGLHPCSVTAVGVVKIAHRGPFQEVVRGGGCWSFVITYSPI